MPDSSNPSSDIITEAELLEAAGGASLRLRFSGPFEGKIVTWDATFTTLANWCEEHPSNRPQRNFIDIGDNTAYGICLIVGLDVPCIDIPTVRKAMMMVRQYKRLARGRHEFGQGVRFPALPEDQG